MMPVSKAVFVLLAMFPLCLTAQQATSLLGKPLYSPTPKASLLAKLELRRENLASDPTADNLIWYARFQAYSGDYKAAIKSFTLGIRDFPKDARMYRHRGHRYITTREFDKAIADFDQAILLIEGKPNAIEPDGMPNEQNIPVSTLHGNIYYHKGLAHYLNGEWDESVKSYKRCRETGENDDNLVSASHWIYCGLRRSGKDRELQKQIAKRAIGKMDAGLNIIENHSYHRAVLFYTGQISAEKLVDSLDDTPAGDSIRYAYANWLGCEGQSGESAKELEKIVSRNGWASFGYIAAEADLARLRDRQ